MRAGRGQQAGELHTGFRIDQCSQDVFKEAQSNQPVGRREEGNQPLPYIIPTQLRSMAPVATRIYILSGEAKQSQRAAVT